MSVLKDLLHGITPAKRKELDKIEADRREAFLHAQEMRRKASYEKICNSHFSEIIIQKLSDVLSQKEWHYDRTIKQSAESLHGTRITIENHYIRAWCYYWSGIFVILEINFEEYGYQKLDNRYERELLAQHIKHKINSTLPSNIYIEITDNKDCSELLLLQKKPEPTPKPPLKSW